MTMWSVAPRLTLAESVKPGIRKRHTEAYIVVLIPQPLDHLAARGGGGGGGGGTRSRGFRPSPHLPRAVRHSAMRMCILQLVESVRYQSDMRVSVFVLPLGFSG